MFGKTGIKKRKGVFGWLWRLVLAFAVISILQVVLLRFINPPVSAFMLWRWSAAQLSAEKNFELRYDWRDLNQISANVPVALVAAEDQLFAEHYGFDVEAIEKAYASNQKQRKVRGGSTISQQTAKNLFLWSGGGYFRKALEAWYTLWIELLWPKQRIIEVYANLAEFGDGIYGVQAAARQFWKTDASGLSAMQAARLAAVLPSPKKYNAANPGPYVARRANWILRQMSNIGGRSYLNQL